jgi:hypothetical protein
MTVWVDDWQMQCCGEPFSVGSRVTWTLREPNTDWLRTVLGLPVQVDAAEEHHGGVPEDTPTTTGKVLSVAAVHCRYPPVPDFTEYTNLSTTDRRPEDRGDLRFVGYLVRLAT